MTEAINSATTQPAVAEAARHTLTAPGLDRTPASAPPAPQDADLAGDAVHVSVTDWAAGDNAAVSASSIHDIDQASGAVRGLAAALTAAPSSALAAQANINPRAALRLLG